MGVTVSWDNEARTIIRYDVVNPWSFEELWGAVHQDNSMFDNINHHFYLIFNGTDVQTVPDNPVSKLKVLAEVIHPDLELIVIVGSNLWLQTLGNLFYRMYGHKLGSLQGVWNARTVEEARELISIHAQTKIYA